MRRFVRIAMETVLFVLCLPAAVAFSIAWVWHWAHDTLPEFYEHETRDLW